MFDGVSTETHTLEHSDELFDKMLVYLESLKEWKSISDDQIEADDGDLWITVNKRCIKIFQKVREPNRWYQFYVAKLILDLKEKGTNTEQNFKIYIVNKFNAVQAKCKADKFVENIKESKLNLANFMNFLNSKI